MRKAAYYRWFGANLLVAAIMFVVLPVPQPASADSLWSRRQPHVAFLFEDNRGRRVGDVVTIAINESSNNNNNEMSNLNKTTNFAHTFSYKGDSSAGKNVSLSGAADLSLTGSSTRALNGTAYVMDTRSFTDYMTVTVIDVLPNGNLVLEGYRTRLLSGEERTLRITGIIRPEDIGAQNTVQSQFIANFQIHYVGRGPDTTMNSYGWWGKLMNVAWPF